MLQSGIHYLLPVIKAAHEQGYYVITADYLPNNIAHKYSDEYVNVSIVEKDAVLKVAQEKQIDGIMSFGVDPGVNVFEWCKADDWEFALAERTVFIPIGQRYNLDDMKRVIETI